MGSEPQKDSWTFTFRAMVMYEMTDLQYQAVYNVLSFALASMMATTMYLWFRHTAVDEKYRSAVLISGLVTFIAAYHYIRIFNSWVASYEYKAGSVDGSHMDLRNPSLTGIPFNDAYRYMDWLLTVPLLLIEILMVMNLPNDGHQCISCCHGYPDWLLRLRYYFQVRRWFDHLSDHIREVLQTGAKPEVSWKVTMIRLKLSLAERPSPHSGDNMTFQHDPFLYMGWLRGLTVEALLTSSLFPSVRIL